MSVPSLFAPNVISTPDSGEAFGTLPPDVTANGTLYFVSARAGAIGGGTRPHNVWRARPVDVANGLWAAPENAGAAVNAGFETNVFVSPDESLMLVSRDGAPDGFGGD